MNQKNFEYLKDQVKFTGFGDALENELKEKLQNSSPEFRISHEATFGNDTTKAVLHFKKSEHTELYFFNSYNVSLKQGQCSNVVDQTFYVNKGNNITLKEAYNLMNGRAVNKNLTNKEGQMYNAWVQLDFKETDQNGNYRMKQYHQNYGFDLEKVLTNLPIKELSNGQEKSRLIDSLNKGNRQSVTFYENGGEHKQFIEANPQFKSVSVYDASMQRMITKQAKGEKESIGEVNNGKVVNRKESLKPDVEDCTESAKASKKKRTKQGQSL
ncbi:MAG TPA: hypothetical protein VF622_14970 [Segetibacter sp.]|jgi:hypothetical protein